MKKKLVLSLVCSISIILSSTISNAQNWLITGNNNTTPFSKLGTTNFFPLGLYTNNEERIRIDETGRVGIGISAPINVLTVKSTPGFPVSTWTNGLTSPVFVGFADNASSESVLAAASNISVRRPVMQGRRARGTLAAPAAVQNDDYLSSFLASGFDGNTFINPATIDFYVDSVPSPGNVPARISFVTGSNQATRKERLKVGSTGNFNFNNDQLFLRKADGHVGIGTTNPGHLLDVAGRMRIQSDGQTAGTWLTNGANTSNVSFIGLQNDSIVGFFGSGGAGWGLGMNLVNGNVAVGSVVHPNSKARLQVNGATLVTGSPSDKFHVFSVLNGFAGNSHVVGISSYSIPAEGWGIGIEAYGGAWGGIFTADGNVGSGAPNAPLRGVVGIATSEGFGGPEQVSPRYGVIGIAQYGTFDAAGYFIGDVWASAYNIISDRKFKTEIALLKNPLQQIMKLKPSRYVFKKDDMIKMGLPKGNQLGLIADELKEVFPELVKEAVHPAEYNKDRSRIVSPEIKYESVNYIGLIPVLVASTQEQQKQIELQQTQIKQQQNQMELQQAQINELKEMVYQLSAEKSIKTGINSVILEQNNPNPLDKVTVIRYSIPAGSKNAQLVVVDVSGKRVKQVQLGSATIGNISFDATGLASGTYTYSIIVDGKLMQSKKMIVLKSNH